MLNWSLLCRWSNVSMLIPQKFSLSLPLPLHDLHCITLLHLTARTPVFFASKHSKAQPPQLLFLSKSRNSRENEKKWKGRKNRCNLPLDKLYKKPDLYIHWHKSHTRNCYLLLTGTNTHPLKSANLVQLHLTPYWLISVIRSRLLQVLDTSSRYQYKCRKSSSSGIRGRPFISHTRALLAD